MISDQCVLSHRELARISDVLAQRLIQEGVGLNQLVAILANKGWEQVVAAKAVLASGAAYLPVAADLPVEYQEKLLERGRVRIVLFQSAQLTAKPLADRLYIPVVTGDDNFEWEASACAGRSLQDRSEADDLAYVIFTSGSTGEPKGG